MAEFDFRPPQLSDREWAVKLLAESDFRGCLYTFGNNYVWRNAYNAEICRFEDFYLLKNTDHTSGTPRFLYPSGSGDIRRLIPALKNYCRELNIPLLMTANAECTAVLKSLYPDVSAVADRDGFDYVYNSSDLAELKGKRYHSKRNHLNRFYENDWSFEPITAHNIPECRDVLAKWLKSGEPDEEKSVEADVVSESLDYFTDLNYTGGLLRVNGEAQAFTFGEPSAADTFVVHAEKALLNYQGAYTAVNCEFAKTLADRFAYINREEDTGSEGLRKAKLSYHPAFLEEKYLITFSEV